MGIDATYIVWSDYTGGGDTTGIFRCDRSSCEATKTFLVTDALIDGGAGIAPHPASLVVHGGNAYWADVDTTWM